FDEARAAYVQAIAQLQEFDEGYAPIANLGLLEQERGRFDEAERRYEEATAICDASGMARFRATVQGYRGLLAHERGDLDRARRFYSLAREDTSAIGHRSYAGFFLACNGALDVETGRW